MDKMENKKDLNQEYQLATIQKYTNNLAQLYSQTLKIRDFAPDNPKWKSIKEALNYSTVLVGCPQILTNEEYNIVKDFLIDEYKDFSAEEILIAFKKVSSGAIKVDIQHYGNLSPMYIGAVLNAFKLERNKALAEEQKNKPKEEIIATDEDKAKIRAEFLERCLFKPYKNISLTGSFDVDLHTAAQLFRVFKRVNLLESSKEDGEYYEPIAIKSLQEEYKSDVRTNKPIANFWERINKMNKGQDKALCDRITDRCQALYFMDYVIDLHKKNRDIEVIAKQL